MRERVHLELEGSMDVQPLQRLWDAEEDGRDGRRNGRDPYIVEDAGSTISGFPIPNLPTTVSRHSTGSHHGEEMKEAEDNEEEEEESKEEREEKRGTSISSESGMRSETEVTEEEEPSTILISSNDNPAPSSDARQSSTVCTGGNALLFL